MNNTQNIIGECTFRSTAGVRQGGATSCCLFTFYIDIINKSLQEKCEPDGYLQKTHTLMLMDDTAILATNRKSLEQKMAIVKQCCDHINMILHPTKCQYLTVGTNDQEDIVIDDTIKITKVDRYTYLGAIISNDTIKEQINNEIDSRMKHVYKYVAFLYKNNDMSYRTKKLVLESALRGVLFYDSETWLCNNLQRIDTVYASALKDMLGVRQQTCTDIVHTETGIPPASATIRQNQLHFYKPISEGDDRPIARVLTLVKQSRTPMAIYICNLIKDEKTPIDVEVEKRKKRISEANTTRRRTYLQMNPTLSVHPMYHTNMPEYLRIAGTRMRLASHRLKIETGRWARIPEELRLCPCGEVQNERHVLIECQLTEIFRHRQFKNIDEITQTEPIVFCQLCHNILDFFK
jgi:hypothetical protein